MPGTSRRLHPLTLLFELGAGIRQMAIPLLLLLFVSQSRSSERQMTTATVALVVTAIGAIARYLSLSYRYDESDLVVRSGIFVRKERHVPYDRIQNIDAVQTLGHRLLGVVKVQVQTGSGTEPEATLSVLPVAALEEMRGRVFARRGLVRAEPGAAPAEAVLAAAAPTKAPAETLLSLSTRELALAGFIENRGMVLILGAIGLLTQIDPLANLAADRIAAWVPGISRADFAIVRLGDGRALLLIASAILALLVFVRVLSTVWAAVRLHDFRLTRSGDDLRMEYGLFTRVSATVSLRRIQTIAIRETLLHRRFGRAAVQVATAGGVGGTAGGAAREWLAPIIPRSQLPILLGFLHPGLALDAVAWRGAHPKAFGRMARASMVMPLIIAAGSAFVIGEWALLIFALLAARALVRARAWVRYMGWSTLADGVAFRGGWLRRTTTVAGFARVQAVAIEESPLDRRAGMADLTVDTAAAQLGLNYLSRDDAAELEALLVSRAAQTAFTW